ncbi:hypothetical protein ACFX1Q_008747 [Malus domestica]
MGHNHIPQANVIDSMKGPSAKKKSPVDADKAAVLNAWRRVDCRTRKALRRGVFAELVEFYEISTNDLRHRISQLEHCLQRIPNHMLVPLFHLSSSDDDSGFSLDCVTPPSRIPCSPVLEHTPLLTPTPKDDLEEDPEEDPEEDLYWVTYEDSLPKHD